jgi:hypothetical protein
VIQVVDPPKPVIIGCTNQTVVVNNGCAGIVVFNCPTATNPCGSTVTVTCNPPSGSAMGPGAHTIIVTATDARGSTTSASMVVTALAHVQVVFDGPLNDDNIDDNFTPDGFDSLSTPTIVNKFNAGQTIPHKVHLLDCNGNDVTDAVGPLVVVKLNVTERQGTYTGSSSLVADVPENYVGQGGAGGLMSFVDHHFQYNLVTKGYDAGTVNTTKFFQSLVTVEYLSNPGVVVGQEDVILESSASGHGP